MEQIRDDSGQHTAEKIGLMTEYLYGIAKEAYNRKEQEIGSGQMRLVEKSIMLQTIDLTWMNHLDEVDYLREGIGLRGYGQRDPLIEYKREAFHMFSEMLENIRTTVINTIFKIRIMAAPEPNQPARQNLTFSGANEEVEQFGAAKQETGDKQAAPSQPIINKDKVGRNDPCPCSSGKKYKKCCGK